MKKKRLLTAFLVVTTAFCLCIGISACGENSAVNSGNSDSQTEQPNNGHQSENSEHTHSYTWVYNNDATCIKDGTETERCSCGKTRQTRAKTGTKLEHQLQEVQSQRATCTEDGIVAHWHCENCDLDFQDEDGKVQLESTVEEKLGHQFGEDGKCVRCSVEDTQRTPKSLVISNETLRLEIGKAVQVTFEVYPKNAIYSQVTYRIISGDDIASIDENGILTCSGIGRVTVAVTLDGVITARAIFFSPQTIKTAEEFYNIRNDLSGVYVLEENIDLSKYESWVPIGYATKNSSGNYDYTNAFNGIFDGNNHTIRGLIIDLSSESCNSLLTVGLFGSQTRDGQILNVALEDVSIIGTASTTTDYVGALVGFNPGTIENCSVKGNLSIDKGVTYIGGLSGENIGAIKTISIEANWEYFGIRASIELLKFIYESIAMQPLN